MMTMIVIIITRKVTKCADLPTMLAFSSNSSRVIWSDKQSGSRFHHRVIGQPVTAATGDLLEIAYLFQCLSICTQLHNAKAFRDTFMHNNVEVNYESRYFKKFLVDSREPKERRNKPV